MKIRLTEEQYNKLIKEQTRFDFPIHGIPDSHKQSYRDYQKKRSRTVPSAARSTGATPASRGRGQSLFPEILQAGF